MSKTQNQRTAYGEELVAMGKETRICGPGGRSGQIDHVEPVPRYFSREIFRDGDCRTGYAFHGCWVAVGGKVPFVSSSRCSLPDGRTTR